jgi:hypothetical protein
MLAAWLRAVFLFAELLPQSSLAVRFAQNAQQRSFPQAVQAYRACGASEK